MSHKILLEEGQMGGYWKVLVPNVVNPETNEKNYIGRAVFSYCVCTKCGKTERYIKNNEFGKRSLMCKGCSNREVAEKKRTIKIGDTYGYLQVVGDGGYENNRHYSLCKCLHCNSDKLVRIMDNKLQSGNTTSCGCLVSKGEEKIKELLDTNNYIYQHDTIFPELLQETGRKLRFDYIIYNIDGSINRFIEFDGRQHIYGPDSDYWSRTKDTLEDIIERDKIKNNFCLSHNYTLVRIPYTKLNNLTIDDLFNDMYIIRKEES